MKRVAVLIGLVLLAGCSSDKSVPPEPTSTTKLGGVAVGIFRITGGPPRRGHGPVDQRLPGLVIALHPGESRALASVNVGRTGRFRIVLPPGRYQLLGRPENRGISPITSRAFRIDPGHTVTVDLTIHAI